MKSLAPFTTLLAVLFPLVAAEPPANYAAQKAELIKLLPKDNAPELPRTGGGEEGEPKKKGKAKK